jgi:hypothetical protein
MGVIVFQEYPARWDYTFNSSDGLVGRWLLAGAFGVISAARRQVGVRTGNLRQSIHIMKRSRYGVSGPGIEIGSKVKYALLHHQGTKPHEIRAELNQFLRFSTKGRSVITRVVQHPGTQANKYLSDNLGVIYFTPPVR